MGIHSKMDQTCQWHVNYTRSAKWHVSYTEIEMWVIPEWAWYVYKINQKSGLSHEAWHGGKQSLTALRGNWNALSPSIFQFGPPAGVQGYIYIYTFQKFVQHNFINLTNYSCAIFTTNYTQTSAHAAKADFYDWTGLHGYITSE